MSGSSRVLITQQEPVFNKDGHSVFDRLPEVLKRRALLFLVGEDVEKCKMRSRVKFGAQAQSFFFECQASPIVSAARKAIYNLAHRIKVNETLAFMQNNPSILQTLPFPIEIQDRHGQRITRSSIIGALSALDEYDVTETKPPYALIPLLLSWFNNADDPKSCHIGSQLQLQLGEQSGEDHIDATKKRMERYLKEIKIFVDDVINCSDISDGSNFENLFDLNLVQNFITNAFKPDPNDDGSLGLAWDCWQIHLDYIAIINSKMRALGGWCSTKTDLIDTVVHMVTMARSQFGHLEVLAKGAAHVGRGQVPDRFDCTERRLPAILDGIGTTHWFYADGNRCHATTPVHVSERGRSSYAYLRFQYFCGTKTSARRDLLFQLSGKRPREEAENESNKKMRAPC